MKLAGKPGDASETIRAGLPERSLPLLRPGTPRHGMPQSHQTQQDDRDGLQARSRSVRPGSNSVQIMAPE